MKPQSTLHIGFSIVLGIGSALFLMGAGYTPAPQALPPLAATPPPPAAVSSTEKEPQVVHIQVSHGYNPHLSHAQAGKPLRLDMETNGVYDCTSSIYIPSLHLRKFLPPTGVTAIDIPPQQKGSTLTVLCAMGMYSFDIQFD